MSKCAPPTFETLVISAPGKVILLGEHAVVHGKRGVALSLDLRTTLTLTSNNDTLSLNLPDVEIKECWPLTEVQRLWGLLGIKNHREFKADAEVAHLKPEQGKIIKRFLGVTENCQSQRTLALLSFFHLLTNILPSPASFSIHVSSQIPTGAGLGSSAAYAACLTGALLVLAGRVKADAFRSETAETIRLPALELASKWTFTSETIMHGSPSGIDNTTCSMGGVVSFKDGDIHSLGPCGLQIMLVNTKIPRSTKALVDSVRQKLQQYPKIINPILQAIDSLSEESLLILKQLSTLPSSESNGHEPVETETDVASESVLYQNLGNLITINHSLLCALGVSHPSLEKVVQLADEFGLPAKLTGAGGGGFAYILLPKHRKADALKQCMNALLELNYQAWIVDLGVPGLCLHSCS
ncbi:mevalonate kinase-like [Hyalella azteca]|uniref:Mevalonate kinase n=1 Tax=Hyalella azteca TaxID=294128 RepID=A0A8B7N3E1_HYAAZ|nr:mevalonate kinase-like [Hyalella azteca]